VLREIDFLLKFCRLFQTLHLCGFAYRISKEDDKSQDAGTFSRVAQKFITAVPNRGGISPREEFHEFRGGNSTL